MLFFGLILQLSVLAVYGIDPDFPADDGEPILVQIVYRSGARSPLYTIPEDRFKWPLGPGQLTQVGIEQQQQLGFYFRQRYIENQPYQYINEDYRPDQVYVRSSDVDYTLSSAYSNLAGLYPGSCEGDMPKIQPIPVHTRFHDKDFPLGPKSYVHCPNFMKMLSTIHENQQFLRVLKDNEDLLIYIANETGLYNDETFEFAGGNTLFHMSMAAYDSLRCQVAEGLPIADWSQVEWNNTGKTVYEHMKGLYRLFLEMQFGGERIAMTGGPIVGAVLENMKNALNGTFDTKLVILSGHDATLASLLLALNVEQQFWDVPWASALMIELVDTPRGRMIQLLYQGEQGQPVVPLTIQNCTVQCPVERFVEIVKGVVPPNWQKECGHRRPMIELNVGVVTLTTVEVICISVAFIILLLLIEAAIFLCIFYQRKKKFMKQFEKYQPVAMKENPAHT